jgi:hypothetical protein
MTQTSTPQAQAVFTLAQLHDTEAPMAPEQEYLELIRLSKQELEALEAGMHGQAPDARERQNAMWNAQNVALQDIVLAALRAGVPAAEITAITHRENW